MIVTVIFTFEMAFKIIGLVIGWERLDSTAILFLAQDLAAQMENICLHHPWNALDFVIVIVAIISIFTGPLATNFSCTASAGGGSILKALVLFARCTH